MTALFRRSHFCLRWMCITLSLSLLFRNGTFTTAFLVYGVSITRSSSTRSIRIMMVSKSLSTRSVEAALHKRGFHFVLGSDEAGRGCIAGPVVVATCCCLKSEENDDATIIEGVDDSKNLSEDERNRIYDEIMSQPNVYAWTVAEASNVDIEESNILKATMEGFRESIEALVDECDLPFNETYSIVDGKKSPKLSSSTPIKCRPYVKADSKVYTVALASVIAKVTRDDIMKNAHKLFPEYGFDQHKGYPTRAHIQAIHEHGPCPLHRMSFKPLKGR